MSFELDKTVEILSQTPATLKNLLGDLSEDWIFRKETEDSWCAFDIVGHLIHAEKTDWIPRARVILAQGENITFEPFDRFGHFEDTAGKTFAQLLADFEKLRTENLAILSGWDLTPDRLKLEGRHPELGRVDLSQLLATWAVHDLTHLRQIATVLAGRYAAAVGPWKAYLSILQ